MIIVLSVSSSRADVGILAPVWHLLAAEPDVELHIFLTGAHVSDAASAVGAVPDAAEVHRGGADLAGRAAPEAAAAVQLDRVVRFVMGGRVRRLLRLHELA